MVYIFRCSCLNVAIHLQSAPTELKQLNQEWDWLLKKTRWSHMGRAEQSLAGVHVAHEKLHSLTETKEKESSPVVWRITTCLNCADVVYASHSLSKNHIFLNFSLMPLQGKSVEELMKISHNRTYSQAYQIFLENNQEAANSLLDAPEEDNQDAVKAFAMLQNRLQNTLKQENQNIDARIDAFIKEQGEAFKAFQMKTYTERKILWHKLSAVNNWKNVASPPIQPKRKTSKTPPIPAADLSKSVMHSKSMVIIEDYSVERTLQQVAPAPTKPLELVPFPEVSAAFPTEPTTQQQSVFEFDEEKTLDRPSPKLPRRTSSLEDDEAYGKEEVDESNKDEGADNKKEDESDEDESEDEGDVMKRVVEPPVDILSSSVPISIPANLLSKSFHPRSKITEEEKKRKDEEELLSKSFDVPVSQNRRTSYGLI
eukprot:TRINITY_DN10511_c0_g1_i1.p1 TRINITY_DN10511_c0_g1~~TRINITY_DN10511_c0_g1_i1.p1  ORF type:complete len:426 (+),score=115.93 TRINITY_DN10511_c0_g1_i1:77-1354(+)